MFTPVDEYTARNRDGVEVSLSREVVSYHREDRWAHFAYEYLILEDALLVYSSAIRAWDAAQGGALISPEERDQILHDVGQAFDALGIKYRIES
ncbi:MAG: Imm74 family immunity protein [Myxococcota bacterium]